MFSVKSLYASYRARHKEKKNIIESPTGFRAYVKRHKIHTDSVNGSSRMIVSILAHIFFFTAMFSLKSAYTKIYRTSVGQRKNLESLTGI